MPLPNFANICAEWLTQGDHARTIADLEKLFPCVQTQADTYMIVSDRMAGWLAMALNDGRVNLPPEELFQSVADLIGRLTNRDAVARLNAKFDLGLELHDFYGNFDRIVSSMSAATSAKSMAIVFAAVGSRLSGIFTYVIHMEAEHTFQP